VVEITAMKNVFHSQRGNVVFAMRIAEVLERRLEGPERRVVHRAP
jgi:hypothetical protein